MRRLFTYTIVVLFLLNLSSCKLLYPNFLLRDTNDFYYYELKEIEEQKQVIMPEDRLNFSLYTRDGFNLIDVIGGGASGGSTGRVSGGEIRGYVVKDDGYVELPLLGDVYVEGFTRLELEDLLEDKYSVWYNDPFIQLNVTNRRVYVFSGVGSAQVLGLPTENTKLIEVIALIGGIGQSSKSYKIRIIRGDYDHPSIKKVDLSTIAGLKDADFIIRPNDIIIIDPKLRPAQAVIREINYLLTIVTTITTVYLLGLSISRR